jgi:hypothetical protein
MPVMVKDSIYFFNHDVENALFLEKLRGTCVLAWSEILLELSYPLPLWSDDWRGCSISGPSSSKCC